MQPAVQPMKASYTMSITQGEAVFQAVCKVTGTSEFTEKVALTKEQVSRVRDEVFAMFISGATLSDSLSEEQLKKYVPGLVNNWMRKDKRLNGGEQYKTKNPGSRTGSGDESLKAMRTLLSVTTDQEVINQIQAAIDQRIEELKPKAAIDLSALPEALRHLVPN